MRRAILAAIVALAIGMPIPAAAQHTHHPPAAAKPAEKPVQPEQAPPGQPKEPIPPVTDADRAAAFPQDLEGHTVHDKGVHYFVLFEQLEWQGGGDGGPSIENTTWIGGDINRAWLRGEAESEDGEVESAFVDALWGHSFSRWWDVVAGIRQDFRPGDPQTWAAVGIQGLAPHWFEVAATAYVGGGGRTHARLEAEYDLLITNRLVLQPVAELDIYGKADRARGLGAGLSSLESGLRLRYEIRRELAPYVGVSWHRKLFGTADRARDAGEPAGSARFVVGLRTWF